MLYPSILTNLELLFSNTLWDDSDGCFQMEHLERRSMSSRTVRDKLEFQTLVEWKNRPRVRFDWMPRNFTLISVERHHSSWTTGMISCCYLSRENKELDDDSLQGALEWQYDDWDIITPTCLDLYQAWTRSCRFK